MKLRLRNIFLRILRIMILNTKNQFNCYLLNFYSFFINSESRYKFFENNYHIKISDRYHRYFSTKHSLRYLKGNISNRLLDEYLVNDLKFEDNDIIIDCGANNGDLFLSFYEKKIRYVGIEASPEIFEILKYNVKNQKLINKAVHNEKVDKIIFYKKDFSGDSSIIEPLNYDKKIEISTTTLDQIIGIFNEPVKLIKIDAEGSEPEVLHGLQKNFKLVKYIAIDVGFERGKENASTLLPCLDYLTQRNFKIIRFSSSNKKRIITLFENQNFA